MFGLAPHRCSFPPGLHERKVLMSNAPGLSGKVALVAGGSRGIGAAVARRLAAMGAEVALTYKKQRDAADAVVSDITTAGGRALAFEVDVIRSDSLDCLVRNVADRCGRIDILVNSAGIAPYRPLGAIDTDYVRD